MAEVRHSVRRWGVAGVAALVALTACTAGDDSISEPEVPVTTAADEAGDVFTETEGAATDGDTADGDSFDPDNAVDEPVEGDFDLEIDDEVIIGTDDGAVPSTTTDPPLPADSADAAPVPEATTTTAAPVPLPTPADVGRIVSLSATHTETLFALGLGEFVVGVDARSDFPAESAAVRRDDLFADSADLSTVLSLDPDVVVVGDDSTGIAARLAGEGVAVFNGPPASSLDDVYAQIAGIAELVGRPDLADDLVGRMRADVAEIVASIPAGERTFFHEIDPSLNAAAADSFLSNVYGELGLVNIAGAAGPGGAAQLTPDDVLGADPEVIVLGDADCCGVTADNVASRAGWSSLSAVQNSAIVAVPDDLTSRWGPRVVDLLRLVAGAAVAAG